MAPDQGIESSAQANRNTVVFAPRQNTLAPRKKGFTMKTKTAKSARLVAAKAAILEAGRCAQAITPRQLAGLPANVRTILGGAIQNGWAVLSAVDPVERPAPYRR
jgi:hypothetical protein